MVEAAFSTDYARLSGDPEPYLRRIAEAGFTAVHWCHQWLGEYRYRQREIHRIAGLLQRYGLKMIDLHAAVGLFSDWSSGNELRRRAGVEQIRNRIEMTAELGGDAVVLHVPEGVIPLLKRIKAKGRHSGILNTAISGVRMEAMRRSLDELEPVARAFEMKIALENLPTPGHMEIVIELIESYPADFVGLCYDSGHGNLAGNGLQLLEMLVAGGQVNGQEESLKKAGSRLAALHLHDNDGVRDLHWPPFRGSVKWDRLMQVLDKAAAAGYSKPVCVESSIRNSGFSKGETGEAAFLQECAAASGRLIELKGLGSGW